MTGGSLVPIVEQGELSDRSEWLAIALDGDDTGTPENCSANSAADKDHHVIVRALSNGVVVQDVVFRFWAERHSARGKERQ